MKALVDEYGQACAARAAAIQVSIGMAAPGQKTPLLLAAEEREMKAREALDAAIREAASLVSQTVIDVETIERATPLKYADDPSITEGYRANFSRPYNARRAFTLKDARPIARNAAQHLRQAWDILDPSLDIGSAL